MVCRHEPFADVPPDTTRQNGFVREYQAQTGNPIFLAPDPLALLLPTVVKRPHIFLKGFAQKEEMERLNKTKEIWEIDNVKYKQEENTEMLLDAFLCAAKTYFGVLR